MLVEDREVARLKAAEDRAGGLRVGFADDLEMTRASALETVQGCGAGLDLPPQQTGALTGRYQSSVHEKAVIKRRHRINPLHGKSFVVAATIAVC